MQEWTVDRPDRAESRLPNRCRGRSRAAAGAQTSSTRSSRARTHRTPPATAARAPATGRGGRRCRSHDERLSVSSVPTSRPLPSEFAHPALQELLRAGATRGTVEAAAVRAACEQAGVPMPRMKAVLRALDDAGITIDVPAGPAAKRAVAATTSRSSAARSPPDTKPARKTAKPARGVDGDAADAPPVQRAAKPAAKAGKSGAKAENVLAGPAGAAADGDLPTDAEDVEDVEDVEDIAAEPDAEEIVDDAE